MADLFFDEIHNFTVVVAPERSKRPKNEIEAKNEVHITCPFCPGNESMTPPESYNFKGTSQNWIIRTFPNKYPAFVHNHPISSLAGIQEVLVETEKHNQKFEEFSIDRLKNIFDAYKQRIEYFKHKQETKYIVVFKNYGEKAGATLEHLHSQIVALNAVPFKIEEQNKKLEEYFSNHNKCYYCHLKETSNLIYENESYFSVMPNDARFSYECLIIPKKHNPYYETESNETFYDLAETILILTKTINSLSDSTSFNLILKNGVYLNSFNELSFHWHFQYIPRTTYLAGFEWATGIFIRQVDHEKVAEQIKKKRKYESL